MSLTGAQSRQTARASAALPAAGAFDAAPTAMPCETASSVSLFATYTRGGAAGSTRLRVEVSPYAATTAGVENWFQLGLYEPDVIVPGSDAASAIQRDAVLYVATGAAAENFVYGPIQLDGTVMRMRVAAAEVGNVGAPGALHLVALFQKRG